MANYLTPELFKQFLDIAPGIRSSRSPLTKSQWRLLFSIMYYGTMRISEARNLIVEEFNQNTQKIYLSAEKTKTKTARIVKINNAEFWIKFKAYVINNKLSPKSFVFKAKNSDLPVDRITPFNYIRAICKKIPELEIEHVSKKKVRRLGYTHLLRKSGATSLFNRGIPLQTVSKKLGHANIATTSVYLIADESESEKKEAEIFD